MVVLGGVAVSYERGTSVAGAVEAVLTNLLHHNKVSHSVLYKMNCEAVPRSARTLGS